MFPSQSGFQSMNLSLRPVETSDASLILSLRNDQARGQYLNHVGHDRAAQELWILNDSKRPDTRYFSARRDSEIEGFLGLMNISFEHREAEWGRWILKPNSRFAVASVFLLYKFCFEELGLESVYCRTVTDNSQVISFHDGCGLCRGPLLKNHFSIRGSAYDAQEHRLDRPNWILIKERLGRIAEWSTRK